MWYNAGMETMKQIMYGVTDFARIRAENGYFVDCSAQAVGPGISGLKQQNEERSALCIREG